MNWLTKVAWHEVQSEWRRQARTSPGPVPELSEELDPAKVVEGELDLDAARRALAILSPSDREAILSRVEQDDDRIDSETAAVKMVGSVPVVVSPP